MKYGSIKVVDQKKRWFYTINPPFSGWRKVVDQKKKSSLQNHFSTLFQKSGCRLNGPLGHPKSPSVQVYHMRKVEHTSYLSHPQSPYSIISNPVISLVPWDFYVLFSRTTFQVIEKNSSNLICDSIFSFSQFNDRQADEAELTCALKLSFRQISVCIVWHYRLWSFQERDTKGILRILRIGLAGSLSSFKNQSF